jgi:phage tail sheath gpL-like
MSILGTVSSLAANDKIPGTYLESRDETGSGVGTRYLWIEGLKASGAGDLTVDSEVREIFSDADALTAWGANSEGYRMALRALKYGVPIKGSAHTISSGVAATALITIDGSWSTTGSLYYRLAGRPVGPIGVASDDTVEEVADAIAAAINEDPAYAATASVAAGSGTAYVVTLTWGSYGTRGNSGTIWQDDDDAPSGLTSTLGGAVAATVSCDAGPWDLAHGDTLVVAFNAGGDQTFTISAVQASVECANAETYNLTNGMTLTVKIDGEATAQTITFLTAEFVAINAATAEEVAAVIAAKILGATASVTSGGTKVTITADTYGTASHVEVTGGTANAVLGFSTTEADGTGNVADVTEVTAAEWVTIMAAITNGTVEDSDDALLFTSTTTGASGTVQIKAASTADDEMGFDNAVHSGSAGGSSLASGGVYFVGGSGTESVATLLTATYSEEFYTQASSVRDATNLGRFETQIDNKLGPLENRLECFVGGLVGTLSASGSIAQTTLNDASFQMPWMDEPETPGEEIAAGIAGLRHLLESASDAMDPNQRYDDVYLDWIQPQEAPSKRPSRATLVSALNYGLTPLATRNGKVYMVRAVTTRTLTDDNDADDGTIDVGTDRVAKRYREELYETLEEHRENHRYLDNNPAEGEEPTVGKDTTFPRRAEDVIKSLNVSLSNRGWISQIDEPENQPRCALNPDSSTPRLVVYAPFVPRPLFHQTEGIVAKKKFVVAVTA